MNILNERLTSKKVCTKITALGLAASAIVTGTALTGCKKEDEVFTYTDDYGNVIVVEGENSYVSGGPEDPYVNNPNTDDNNPNNTDENPGTTTDDPNKPNPSVFVPTYDFSIDEENIKAADVLANLDEMVTDFAEMYLYCGYKIIRENHKFSAKFSSLSPNTYLEIQGFGYDKYAYLTDSCTPTHYWLTDEEFPHYKENINTIQNAYHTTLIYSVNDLYKTFDVENQKIIIPQKEYEKILELFGNQKHILTQEMVDSSYEGFKNHLTPYIGKEVYDSLTLTREMVEKATPEQLIAINDLIEAMYEINMFGEVPENTN